jgi:hypothetical protein
MRTLFHRLGAGALLAGAAMLSGCLNSDKPKPLYPANTTKPANTTTNQPTSNQSNNPQGFGGQPNNATPFGPGNAANNNGQSNLGRSNNSIGALNDANRVGLNSGPINNGGANAVPNNAPPYNGNLQPVGGIAANSGAASLQPIGRSTNSLNPIQPVNPNGSGQPGNVVGMPPLDPPPSRSAPAPVSMQGADGDVNIQRITNR